MNILETRGIKKNLRLITAEYNRAMSSRSLNDSLIAAFNSKMALMEVGGWIEQSIDAILYYYIDHTVKNQVLSDVIKKEIVDKTYGFRYSREFRPLCEKILGAARFSRIIKLMDRKGLYQILQSSMTNLATDRNRAAHTYWTKVTPCFDSPYRTEASLMDLIPALKCFWSCVRRSSHSMH